MGSKGLPKKLHAVCIPWPLQSHINAMLQLTKLLYHKGFHITFVNTEHSHTRLLKSRGQTALDGLPGFRFRTIPDGLPPIDIDANRNHVALMESIVNYMSKPFCELVSTLVHCTSPDVPAVSCIISDGFMSFTANPAAEKFGIPIVHLWTISACSFMGFKQYRALKEKGLTPLKDASYLTNGYLNTSIDWIPGMKDVKLKDLPAFLRTLDTDDFFFKFAMDAADMAHTASAMIIHTFDALESDVLDAISKEHPHVYAIGPFPLLIKQELTDEDQIMSINCNLWKEDRECLKWLDSKEPNSVLYVNFGSVMFLTKNQLVEFAMGLANSKQPFLWAIRPDLVKGEAALLPPEFTDQTKERGLVLSWIPQVEVINHPSVGGFLTHCGWSSIMESISAGVPMLCWPVAADRPTNCAYACSKWGIGLEIENDVRRGEVERLVRELMEGEKNKGMKNRAKEWKKMAEEAISPNGSSNINFDKLLRLICVSQVDILSSKDFIAES